jgi:hypothetical protein
MQHKNKAYSAAIITFMTLSMLLLTTMFMPMANAAGAITLTPTSQATGASVSVAGTGFGTTKAVGIGFGTEVSVSQTNMSYTGTGVGPYGGTLAYAPIKPGSFSLTSDTTAGGGVVTEYTDNGDGTLASTSTYFAGGTINYVTGQWSRTSTIDLTDIVQVYNANYIRYNYTVTPVGGVTTSGTGAFTTSITVPNVAAGTYTVTAIDTSGNRATSSLTVTGSIPETLTIGVVVVLSTFVTLVSFRYFREQPKIRKFN